MPTRLGGALSSRLRQHNDPAQVFVLTLPAPHPTPTPTITTSWGWPGADPCLARAGPGEGLPGDEGG
eukprot:10182208-Alexandrium_andersonii.AAC.1